MTVLWTLASAPREGFVRRKRELQASRRGYLSSVVCSFVFCYPYSVLGWPGGDLLSRVLRQSTIGAEAFDGRVRDGIGSYRLAEGHQAGEDQRTEGGEQRTAGEELPPTPVLAVRRFKVEAKLVFFSDRRRDGRIERYFLCLPSSVFRLLIPSLIKPNGRLVPVS